MSEELYDLEQEIQERKEEKKNITMTFTSRASIIDPYLPHGIGHTGYSKEENIILKYSHGRKIEERSQDATDKQWSRLLKEGFDTTQDQYKLYIKCSILSWYDLDPSLREIHDREMEQWREGQMMVSRMSFDNKAANAEYVSSTYACENESMEIAKKILDNLDMTKISLNRRRRKWIIKRYKIPFWQEKRLSKMEE